MTGTRRLTDDVGWQEEAGYSRAVRRGNVVVVSGTTATGLDGAALHPGDTGAQARLCLDRIEQALTALGERIAKRKAQLQAKLPAGEEDRK